MKSIQLTYSWARRFVLFVALVFVVGYSASAFAQSKPKLQGEWKISYVKYTSPSATWDVANPPPSIVVFGKEFYSVNGVPEAGRPEDVIPFLGTAGAYEVDGNKLTLHPTVDNGSAASSEVAYSQEIRTADNMVWLTYKNGDATVVVRLSQM